MLLQNSIFTFLSLLATITTAAPITSSSSSHSSSTLSHTSSSATPSSTTSSHSSSTSSHSSSSSKPLSTTSSHFSSTSSLSNSSVKVSSTTTSHSTSTSSHSSSSVKISSTITSSKQSSSTSSSSVKSSSTISSHSSSSISSSSASATAKASPLSFPSLVVYWGQNSAGGQGLASQTSLATYCQNPDIDVIALAFLTAFGGVGVAPTLNFANIGNLAQIGLDITTCQTQYNKKILLSFGGSSYSEGGFPSVSAANQKATQIWSMFGPNSISSGATRPFGNAVLDGFDFDIETSTTNMIPFAQTLRSAMDTEMASSPQSKPYYMSAAPQCFGGGVVPDANVGSLMNTVSMDFVFIQFYNNPECSPLGSGFNFATWNSWATGTSSTGLPSANKATKLFLGMPAAVSAAGSGYMTAAQLAPVIKSIKTFKSFGGVMLWDVSQAYANPGFLDAVSSGL